MPHIVCIPRNASLPDVPRILFKTLQVDVDWEEDPSVAVHGLGQIRVNTRGDLAAAADIAICRTLELVVAKEQLRPYTQFIVMLLRQVVDRMSYLLMVVTRSLAVAAHIQRLCLELAGLRTYVDVVIGHIESPEDFSAQVLDIIRGFLHEGAATQTWHRVGIPY